MSVVPRLPASLAMRITPSPVWLVSLLLTRDDPAAAVRCLKRLAATSPEIAALLRIDEQLQSGAIPADAIADAMPIPVLQAFVTTGIAPLRHAAKAFNALGCLRLGGALRALVLLRVAAANIASGEDRGWQHEAVLLEIAANDHCARFMARPEVMPEACRTALQEELQAVAGWSLARKVSVLVGQDSPAMPALRARMAGRSLRFQGPSSRSSDLDDTPADLTCVVGYSGPGSLARPVDSIGVSLYKKHKIAAMRGDGLLHHMADVQVPVLNPEDLRQERAFYADLIEKYGASLTNVRWASLNSQMNAGTELFVWMLNCGASSVSVSHLDLFLNRTYPPGYLAGGKAQASRDGPGWQMEEWSQLKSFGYHEPSQQFAIYRAFHPHREVAYDGILDAIVEKPFSAYASALEDGYRVWRGRAEA